jgi:hypothetical protein
VHLDLLVAPHPGSCDGTSAAPVGSQAEVSRTTTAPLPARSLSTVITERPSLTVTFATVQPGPNAWHQRHRRHRLGLQPQRLQIGAAEVGDVQRRRAGLAAGDPTGDGGPQERQQHRHEGQQPDAADAPPLDPDRVWRAGQQADELGVQVAALGAQQAAELGRQCQPAGGGEALADLLTVNWRSARS